MADNCNPKYKNLNRIQSFSEQKYATVQLMQQICMNGEYLKQKVDELTYLSPPAVRKTFSPINVDDSKSWGYQINTDNTVSFNSSTNKDVFVDFTEETLQYVDMENSTCEIYISADGKTRHARVPQTTQSTINTSTSDWDARAGTNEFWYVGYDHAKTYQVVPEWVNDIWDKKIPSVCRAQTIKITGLSSDDKEAKLTGVVLRVQYGGSVASNVGSPLYVQLRKTVDKPVEKYNMTGEFSNKEFTFKSYNPKQYETIKVPDSNPYDALATAVYYPTDTTPGNVTLVFDNPATVKNGETYALVFASPLSHYDHAPRVGGWGRKCDPDPYEYGYAFISENNGYTWNRYGKDDYSVNYRFGKRWPRDFAFRCHVTEYKDVYVKDKEYYLYLKPIHCNPIRSVQLSSNSDKVNQTDSIIFEVSSTGYPNDWIDITSTRKAIFEIDEETGNYPTMLFVRARMKTSNISASPTISNIRLGIVTEVTDEMYVRTNYYYPPTDPMLGANMWGRVYAPFKTEPSTECSAEIISNETAKEHFTLINPIDLPNYTWIDGIDKNKVTGKSESQLHQYLNDNEDIRNLLAENNIYVVGFVKSIKFNNSPAYPLQGCYLQPSNPSIQAFNFGEWYDYEFDYTDDKLTFHDETIEAGKLIEGTLRVEYNPLFVDNLSNLEVGRRINDETGLVEEGLVLDYFKETFVVTDEHIENREIKLRVSPVDPIRSVILNKDTDDEVSLAENVDYTLDADNKSIIFEIVSSDGVSSRLNLGDTVEVVYTPSLKDAGISIGYHAKRNDLKKEVYIQPNYLEYKV